ncbi:hypothetical protein M407DRAFT_226136 [Tulasnella calospora MUT 4182]|uniref:Uncharacterized protein n=1 Tax=Tulasnella calospora MUT 4182 TaxID=1051891 RepID=A0A0C3L801_9AGAM|nr:hypothetical protein M407DRAFT_226136 [Tulasnella calospora MUT 4182]
MAPGAQDAKKPFADVFGDDREKSDGCEILFEEAETMMRSLYISTKRNVITPAVKLVSPPASYPKTSILRPATTPNPQPQESGEPKEFSPSEYTTDIGNASVVHQIYLEARNTGIPRTAEQELARQQRACEMVFKEMKEIAHEVQGHLNGRGYQEGPWPSVLQGVEGVSKEEKRKWLLERRALMIKRRSKCRLTAWDNNEAADHLFVVLHALYVCRQAGAERIMF